MFAGLPSYRSTFAYASPFSVLEGVSFGVADGVGGWIESGVDPALFSQALMYHAHRYSRNAWAGEPEIDPTMDYEEREQIEGWEMTPYECLDLAYGGVLREKYVQAGAFKIQSRYLSQNLKNPIFKVQVQRASLALMHHLVFCVQQSKPLHPLHRSLKQPAERNSQSWR